MKPSGPSRLLIGTVEALGTALLRGAHGDALRRRLDDGSLPLETFALDLQRAVFWLAARSMAQARRMLPAPPKFTKKSSAALGDALRREELRLRGEPRMLGGALLSAPLPPGPLRRVLDDPCWRDATTETLGEGHEALLSLQPERAPDGLEFRLIPCKMRSKKTLGCYYTRAGLRASLLEGALGPLLEGAPGASGPLSEGAPGASGPLLGAPEASGPLLGAPEALTVCDPTCGAGNLLVEAARRLARGERRGVGAVVERSLYGVDIDPVAVELCRLALWLEGGFEGRWPARLEHAIRCGDSLQLPWGEVFPEVFARGGFDCIVGNPPFVNRIEGPPRPRKAPRRGPTPEFGGTADLAYLLLGASLRLAGPRGRVGMIQPRGVLNARPAERFRGALPGGFRLVELRLPTSAALFPGAAVFVCQVFFARGEDRRCSVFFEASPAGPAGWFHGELRGENWWSEALRIGGRGDPGAPEGTVVLADRFVVEASMTAKDAYDAIPALLDEEHGEEPRLLTTGLIDPDKNLWGVAPCRFLGQTYRFPRLRRGAHLSRSLHRRATQATRPKILVAGLSSVVECVLDRRGEYIGSVSTYSLFHPQDDLGALEDLCAWLLSPGVTERFRVVLGANALGGGNTTMTKDFLRTLPIPGHPPGQTP